MTHNGVLKNKLGLLAGTYKKSSELINKRSHWNQINEDIAIWYDIINNVWMIGPSRHLGSTKGGISSVQDSACPTSSPNLFQYGDVAEGKWRLVPDNSFSIQCV